MKSVNATQCILPGGIMGIVGGGQLGRMSAIEARKMGYGVIVLDPDPRCPAAAVVDRVIAAPYNDPKAMASLAAAVDVITFEFENISVESFEGLKTSVPIRPSPDVLRICQHRETEKRFLTHHGFPCASFWVVTDELTLRDALVQLDGSGVGGRGVLKTATFGYDGKGQLKVDSKMDAADVWQRFGAARAVLEEWVDFAAEFSVICARTASGAKVDFPVAENIHHNHVLDLTIVPCRLPESITKQAREIAWGIADCLNLCGVLAIEFFVRRDGQVLVNELAPRPHNSGHFSFDACLTSQFEQHVRSVAGLPLGDTTLLRPVVMSNLLGDLWRDGRAPDWTAILSHPRAKLHLYGKQEAKPGRKMGHFCVLGDTVEEALREANELRKRVGIGVVF